MSKYLDMIEIVELITSRMRDGEEGNDRLINTLNDQTNELNKRFRTINDKDAKINGLEGRLKEREGEAKTYRDLYNNVVTHIVATSGKKLGNNFTHLPTPEHVFLAIENMVKTAEEAQEYRDLYNELNKMLDNEGYECLLSDAKNKLTALLVDRDMYCNDAVNEKAKATKLNSEKRKLMEIMAEALQSDDPIFTEYKTWLKERADKRGK